MLKTLSEDDVALFREVVGEVKPVEHDSALIERPRPEPIPAQTRLDEERVKEALLNYLCDPSELDTGEELLYVAPGVTSLMLRNLRRGRYSVEAELDLHGMTVAVARQALTAFLRAARAAGKRCTIIIHGKGHGSYQKQPVLKGKLNLWLRRREEVLAFCSARPVDGGTGALYVLLRRR